jgi:hypothetical protein
MKKSDFDALAIARSLQALYNLEPLSNEACSTEHVGPVAQAFSAMCKRAQRWRNLRSQASRNLAAKLTPTKHRKALPTRRHTSPTTLTRAVRDFPKGALENALLLQALPFSKSPKALQVYAFSKKHREEMKRLAVLDSPIANLLSTELLYQYMPHHSEEDETRLAYCQSYEKFEREGKDPLYTVTSPGKFLAKLRKEHDLELSDEDIKKASDAWLSAASTLEPTFYWNHEHMFTLNARKLAWFDLYSSIHVDKSCMLEDEHDRDSDDCDDEDELDPARNQVARECIEAYALDPNLGLVYWVNDKGHKVGRSIVRRHGNSIEFIRGFPSKHGPLFMRTEERLNAHLQSLGFVKGDLEGIKLLRLEEGGYFLVPYLDGPVKRFDDCDSHLLVTNQGHYKADDSDGCVELDATSSCQCCGDEFYELETVDVLHGYHYVCTSCFENEYREVFTNKRNRTCYALNCDAVEFEGDYYHVDRLDECGLVQCEHCASVIRESDSCYEDGYTTCSSQCLAVLIEKETKNETIA